MPLCKIIAPFQDSNGIVREDIGETYECSQEDADRLVKAQCLLAIEGGQVKSRQETGNNGAQNDGAGPMALF